MEQDKKTLQTLMKEMNKAKGIERLTSNSGVTAAVGAIAISMLGFFPFAGPIAAMAAGLSGYGLFKAHKDRKELSLKIDEILDKSISLLIKKQKPVDRKNIIKLINFLCTNEKSTLSQLSKHLNISVEETKNLVEKLKQYSLLNEGQGENIYFSHIFLKDYFQKKFSDVMIEHYNDFSA